MSFTDQIAKLEKAKADIAIAEAKLASDRVTALAKLPSDYGFSDLKAPKAAKGKRAKITDEIKAQVKALAESGKTGQEIAKALGISAPSVQNIKKAFGMVKARGTSEVAPAVAAPAAEVV
jgi:hypothetical protein